MSKTTVALVGIIILSAGLQGLWSAPQPDNPAVLLRAAIEKEEVDGDLDAAIEQYKQIIKIAGADRAVAAKALLRLGGCYEKRGPEEARRSYQQLIRDYAEQAKEVAAARQRLAALATSAEPPKPAFRKIQVPTKLSRSGSGKLSPDGRTLAFIEDGSLWTIPVHGKSDPNIAGAPARLTEPMHAWDVANISIEWSADGKWIAFRVAVPRLDAKTPEEIYVVPAGGGTPRRIPITWQDWAGDVYTLRYALSAGGEILYFADGPKLSDLRIYSMSSRGAERRAIALPTTRQPALSPDGSRIAYVKGEEAEGGALHTKEVWVANADGTGAQLAYRLPGDAKAWVQGPIWSPDGRRLAFLASARGNRFTQDF